MTARVGTARLRSWETQATLPTLTKAAKTVPSVGRDGSLIPHHARARGKTEQSAYRITLVALSGDPPAIVRLRRALKTLLRAYRLRCRLVEALPAPPGKRHLGSGSRV